MNKSKGTHSLAKLRLIIQKNQREMADLIGVSIATIQKIELDNGTLKLSDSLADRVCLETGIDKDWIMGVGKKHPIYESGQPYTKDTFIRHRAELESQADSFTMKHLARNFIFCRYTEKLGCILSSVSQRDLMLFGYKLKQAFSALEKEFGASDAVLETSEQQAAWYDAGIIHKAFPFHPSKDKSK